MRKHDKAPLAAANYIAESGTDQITIAELCLVANVSERTLEYAFREQYNLTPKSYTLMHRMNNVRKQLHKTNPSKGAVSEIARLNGFWHMGNLVQTTKRYLPNSHLKL